MHQYLAFHENVGQAGRQWTVLAPNQEADNSGHESEKTKSQQKYLT